METTLVPRGAAAGLRKLTTNHLLAARLAEQARGLPAGIKHPNQLLAALRRAAPYLGHNRLLPLMEALFRWTQPQDWAPEAEPVVWPSNEALALELDCSERHVSRLIAAAIEARLISPRDGTDRKRRGCRQNGHILWAWGLNLRPMAAHHAAFAAAAAAGEQARRRCRDLRREASVTVQSLAQMLELARVQGLPAGALEAWHEEGVRRLAALRRMEQPTGLEAELARIQALAERGRCWLEHPVEDGEMSGSADSHVRPILPTKTPTEPKGSTVTARSAPCPASPRPEGLARTATEARAANPTPPPGSSLAPEELMRLAPRLRACLASPRPGWNEVSDAASLLAQHLGIPRGLYGEACGQLGRRPAAIAIAIISTKQPGHFHSAGAGGYLRGMLRRAREGGLHLDRSIFGLRDRVAAAGS